MKKMVDDKEVEITTYQHDHKNEILVKDVESGICSLFYKGVLKMKWKEEGGKKTGGITEYEMGKALRSVNYGWLDGQEHRHIENNENGLELVIYVGKENHVIYRGEYDNVLSMKREGKGIEYDEKSERVLRCGKWKDDELFQVIQEFESEEVMIEYKVEEGEENASMLNRHPVYEGEYVFDEATSEAVRHGRGYEIDVNTGCAMREGKWENGQLVEKVNDLYDGWYRGTKCGYTVNWGLTVEDKKVEIKNLNDWKNVDLRVTELVIPSSCCNDAEFTSFDVSGLKWLKSIEIASSSCQNVNEVKLIGMKRLEKVVIGDSCFKKNDGSFYLRQCPVMKELRIGIESFRYYVRCEFEDLPSLEKIVMGNLQPQSMCNCFYNASLELKSMGRMGVIDRIASVEMG